MISYVINTHGMGLQVAKIVADSFYKKKKKKKNWSPILVFSMARKPIHFFIKSV